MYARKNCEKDNLTDKRTYRLIGTRAKAEYQSAAYDPESATSIEQALSNAASHYSKTGQYDCQYLTQEQYNTQHTEDMQTERDIQGTIIELA